MVYFNAKSKQTVIITSVSKDYIGVTVNLLTLPAQKYPIKLYKQLLQRLGKFKELKVGDDVTVAYGLHDGAGQWYGVTDETKMTSPCDLIKKGLILYARTQKYHL